MPRKNLISLHEAIVLALINTPLRTATFKDIAEFIESRNLYPDRIGNISLEKQVMLRSTKSNGQYKNLFEQKGPDYICLKDTEINFAIRLYSALEALLENDQRFYLPPAKSLSVISRISKPKELFKVKLSPKQVVCIISPNKSRIKAIYYVEKESDTIQFAELNNNIYSFEKLCDFLDPKSDYLSIISKSAIVNVAYFDLIGKKHLRYIGSQVGKNLLPEIVISARKEAEINLKAFKLIKESYNRWCFLQKVAIGYKTETGFE